MSMSGEAPGSEIVFFDVRYRLAENQVCVFASILHYVPHHAALNAESFGALVSLYGVAHLFPGPI